MTSQELADILNSVNRFDITKDYECDFTYMAPVDNGNFISIEDLLNKLDDIYLEHNKFVVIPVKA